MSRIQPDKPAGKTSANNLARQLGVYSLSAAAAGVSLLALAAPATAEVVVHKAHLPVARNIPLLLDLNKDGVADFQFQIHYGRTSYFSDMFTVCAGTCGLPAGNEVVASKGNVFVYASALMRGAKIGPSAHFDTAVNEVTVEGSFGDFLSGRTDRNVIGRWGHDPQNRYLGVKFLINGQTHFGWVRLTVKSDKLLSISATITGYAYETVPNKPIFAGTAAGTAGKSSGAETQVSRRGPSLGMLAGGADALPRWREAKLLTV
jgi:hypothetical protein